MNGCILDEVYYKRCECGGNMRKFIISEERLKMLLKHERELCYAKTYSTLYAPSSEELEVTEDDLKPYTEIKEHEYVPDIDFEPDFSVLNND